MVGDCKYYGEMTGVRFRSSNRVSRIHRARRSTFYEPLGDALVEGNTEAAGHDDTERARKICGMFSCPKCKKKISSGASL